MYTRIDEAVRQHERQVGRDVKSPMRIAVGKDSVRKLIAGIKNDGDDFRGYRLWEIARRLMLARGQKVNLHPATICERAITDSDFGHVIDDASNTALQTGYRDVLENHKIFTDTRYVPDFRPYHVNIIEVETPVEVNGEFDWLQLADNGEVVQLRTQGAVYPITEKTLLNSSLADLKLLFKGVGEGLARREGDLVFQALTDNPTTNDGTTLFHADHGNIATGASPSVGALNEMIKLMRAQSLLTDSTKSANIVPRFIICPSALEASVENLLKSLRDDKTQNVITCVADGRLDKISETAWYLVSENAVSRFLLEGSSGPSIATQPAWRTSNLEVRVRHDLAAAVTDWRRCCYSAGA